MVNYVAADLQGLLAACSQAQTAHAKGEALADLVEHVFTAVPSVATHARNHLAPNRELEVDLVFSHRPVESKLPCEGVSIQVECKNQATKISASQVRDFLGKLKARNKPVGLMVSRLGLSGRAGSAGHSAVETAVHQGTFVVVATAAELAALITTDDLVDLIHRRRLELELDGRLTTI